MDTENEAVLKKRIAELERQLESQKRQLMVFEGIVSEMPGHIYWKDKNSVYLGCNKYAAKMAGLNYPKEIIGKSDYELAWKNQADELIKNDKYVMQHDTSLVKEEVAHLSDGRVATYVSHKKVLKDKDGKITGTLGISIDISELKKLEKAVEKEKEKAKKANKSKIQLFNAINQVICTKLTGVLGGSQLIGLAPGSPLELKERLTTIYESGESILPILQSIYYYLDLEQGKLKILEDPINLRQLIDSVLEKNMGIALDKGIKLELAYDDHITTALVGDSVLIKEVLYTLIYNALRFTQTGRVSVEAKLVQQKGAVYNIAMTVSDTGIGIAKDKQLHLFSLLDLDVDAPDSAFAQVGIKLSLAQMIARVLGGDITLKSSLGKGAKFTFSLPLKEAPDAKPELVLSLGLHLAKERYQFAKALYDASEVPQMISKEKAPFLDILMVEDDLLNLRVVKELLEMVANCKVTTAMTITEAKTKLDRHYHLFLLDINLPDGNGVELVAPIKKKKQNKENPIIAVTAHVTEEEVDLLTAQGIDCVVTKPVTRNKLEDVLIYFVYYRSYLVS